MFCFSKFLFIAELVVWNFNIWLLSVVKWRYGCSCIFSDLVCVVDVTKTLLGKLTGHLIAIVGDIRMSWRPFSFEVLIFKRMKKRMSFKFLAFDDLSGRRIPDLIREMKVYSCSFFLTRLRFFLLQCLSHFILDKTFSNIACLIYDSA